MKSKQGFTLLEVLITTLIMVSVLGALAYGLNQSTNLTETVRNQDIALSAAQDKIEEIANDVDNITDYNGQTFNIAGLTPDPAGVVAVNQVGSTNLFDINITVSWQQRGGRQISRSVSTVLVQK